MVLIVIEFWELEDVRTENQYVKLLYRHDLSPRSSVRAFSMADFMVECQIMLLNIYCLCSEVRLTLESEKWVKLQE